MLLNISSGAGAAKPKYTGTFVGTGTHIAPSGYGDTLVITGVTISESIRGGSSATVHGGRGGNESKDCFVTGSATLGIHINGLTVNMDFPDQTADKTTSNIGGCATLESEYKTSYTPSVSYAIY